MSDIFFEHQGLGNPVILIHGFPMNHFVWKDFAPRLATHASVYTPDLPGFGQSKILPSPFSIDDVADKLLEWIESNDIGKSVLVGHSLGGYVALSMVEKRPDLFVGLGLFHSTALADSPEKKDSRTKVVEFVETNGAPAFTSNFIAPLFADPTHPAISLVREIAVQSSPEAVMGFTQAMRDRPSRETVLKNFERPILFIAGGMDQGIPVKTIEQQAALAQYPDLHILSGAAHMGMFEQPSAILETLTAFVGRCHAPVGS
jgi:pimeloyl-ACP methyl ester carboxylesterase